MKVGLENPTIFVAALIPISMFTGIIVNTICFVYIFPKIKKNRSITEEGEKFKVFREKMLTKILDHYTEHFEIKDKDEFEYFFDEKSFLLNRQDMSNYQYIRTGYFYYLEFQLNSILTIILAVFTFTLNVFLRDFTLNNGSIISPFEKTLILSIVLLVSSIVCLILHKAILKNYDEYVKKELSYMLGAFHICKANGSKS